MSEHQKVIYFCLSFCRVFKKLLSEIDNEDLEDLFDMFIVANLTDDGAEMPQAKRVYADQVGLF